MTIAWRRVTNWKGVFVYWDGPTGRPDERYTIQRADDGRWSWKYHHEGAHDVLGHAGTTAAAKRRVEAYDVERRISHAEAAIAAEGWTLVYQEYVEDSETPGLLGQMGGITMPSVRKIKVKTHEMSRAQIAAILEHEIEHMHGAHKGTDHPDLDLACGGRYSPFGDA